MIGKLVAPVLIAAVGLAVPGGSAPLRAQKTREIRVAMLAPRGSIGHREFQKVDQQLRKITNNEWGIRIYPSGAAGDEVDVIRKMRVQQMDGALITTTGLSQIVRQVAVLDAPGVINGYSQLEAVQKAMRDEWDKMFLEAGVKMVCWWEAGRYRIFSKGPVRNLSELRNHRAWLWPESHVLKELWRAAGITGIPLGVPDVFGALQTGMVDLLIATPVTLVALRWHMKLDHLSKREAGVLLLSWVMNKSVWESMPESATKEITKQIEASGERYRKESRKEDSRAYQTLLQRGYTADEQTPEGRKEWEKVEETVRKRLTGRVYPPELLARVMSIAARAK
jgi:TRAP-type C4-dicarboxylate transport system substrate-binding protein